MVKTISSRSSSRVSEQVDGGMRDGKGAHTIRDLCYHKQEGAEKTWGGGSKHVNGKINYQLQKSTPLVLIS